MIKDTHTAENTGIVSTNANTEKMQLDSQEKNPASDDSFQYLAVKNGKQLFGNRVEYRYNVHSENHGMREISTCLFDKARLVTDMETGEQHYIVDILYLDEKSTPKRKKDVKITITDLSSPIKLVNSIGVAGLTISATGETFDLLKEALHRSVISHMNASTVSGLHMEGFLLPEGYLTKHGLCTKSLILSKKLDMVHEKIYKFPMPSPEEWSKVAREFMERVVFINTATKMLIILGWFLSSPLRKFMLEQDIQPGILNVYGTKNSGKTSTVALMLKFFGFVLPKGISASKLFSIIKMSSMFNHSPIWIDEFRESLSNAHQIHELLRNAYDGITEFRGQGDLSSVTFPMNSPFVLTGEDPPHDPATCDRLCSVHLQPHDIESKVTSTNYVAMDRIVNKSYFVFGYLEWMLKEIGFDGLKDMLNQSRNDVIALEVFTATRPMKTGIAVYFGLLLGIKLMEFLKMDASYTVEDARKAITELAVTIERKRPKDTLLLLMYEIRENCRSIFRTDYDIRYVNGILTGFFKQSAVLNHLMNKGKIGISEDSVRQRLRENIHAKGFILAESKPATTQGEGNRCLVVDLEKLCRDYSDEFTIDDWENLMPQKNRKPTKK